MTVATAEGSLANVVRAARIAQGMSQCELARRSGLDRRTIGRVETGDVAAEHTLSALGEALGLPYGTLGERTTLSEDARVGRLLRLRRRSLGLTLVDVSGAVGIRDVALSRLERGITSPRGGWRRRLDEDVAKSLGFRREEDLLAYLGISD